MGENRGRGRGWAEGGGGGSGLSGRCEHQKLK